MFTPSINIEPFVTSSLGMGCKTFSPAQMVVLKLMAGEPLDDNAGKVRIPVDPLDPNGGSILFTEQGFLEYLQAQGRAHLNSSSKPAGVVLLAGRRSGKTSILSMKMFYDLSVVLDTNDFQKVMRRNPTARFTFTSDHGSYGIAGKHHEAMMKDTWLGSKRVPRNSTQTRFETGSDNKAIVSYSTNAPLRGYTNILGAYVDEAISSKNFSYGEYRSYVKKYPNCQFFVAASPNGQDKTAKAMFDDAKSSDDILGLSLHTWELNPIIPNSVYQEENSQRGNLLTYASEPSYWG